MTLAPDGERVALRRCLVRPHEGGGPVPQFDPLEPPAPAEGAPPIEIQHVAPFTACHILAFGTAYTLWHYRNEAERRLFAHETLTTPYDGGYPLASPEAGIIKWLEWADSPKAAHLYAQIKSYAGEPIAKRLQLAAGVLMEAARRGELTVSAVREGAEPFDYVTLSPTEFLERPDFRYWGEFLVDRGQRDIHKAEFNKVRFLRDQVMALRGATWHSMAPPQSDLPPTEERPVRLEPNHGEVIGYLRNAANLQRARDAFAEAPSRNAFCERIAEQLLVENGLKTTGDKVANVARGPNGVDLSRYLNAEYQIHRQNGRLNPGPRAG